MDKMELLDTSEKKLMYRPYINCIAGHYGMGPTTDRLELLDLMDKSYLLGPLEEKEMNDTELMDVLGKRVMTKSNSWIRYLGTKVD